MCQPSFNILPLDQMRKTNEIFLLVSIHPPSLHPTPHSSPYLYYCHLSIPVFTDLCVSAGRAQSTCLSVWLPALISLHFYLARVSLTGRRDNKLHKPLSHLSFMSLTRLLFLSLFPCHHLYSLAPLVIFQFSLQQALHRCLHSIRIRWWWMKNENSGHAFLSFFIVV